MANDMAGVAPGIRKTSYDVVIVGGGAAGLSAALTLSRARRSVLVVDAGQPRNAPAAQVHGYLAREGTPPGELLEAGRREVAGYGGELMVGEVVSAEPLESGGFRVGLRDGASLTGRRLLVATGLVDRLPEVPGVAERWGRDVLHCPYCHGWEVRDRAIGILAGGPRAVEMALHWRQWSALTTLFLDGEPEPSDAELEQLAARDVTLVRGKVARLEVIDDRLSGVRLAGGQVVPCQAVVVATRMIARDDVLTSLGLKPTEQEIAGHVVGTYVAADPRGATSVAGVWVAGNVTSLMDQVIGAASAGVRAAAAINADLVAEDTRQAVAARRNATRIPA